MRKNDTTLVHTFFLVSKFCANARPETRARQIYFENTVAIRNHTNNEFFCFRNTILYLECSELRHKSNELCCRQ